MFYKKKTVGVENSHAFVVLLFNNGSFQREKTDKTTRNRTKRYPEKKFPHMEQDIRVTDMPVPLKPASSASNSRGKGRKGGGPHSRPAKR